MADRPSTVDATCPVCGIVLTLEMKAKIIDRSLWKFVGEAVAQVAVDTTRLREHMRDEHGEVTRDGAT